MPESRGRTEDPALLFHPPSGPVRGWRDGEVRRATGIPYAVSERFEKPRPSPDRSETLRATRWAPACPQNPVPALDAAIGFDFADMASDERCQRLSVTVPKDVEPGEALPVMVWIHGGSYVSGAGDVPVMDPAGLVIEQRVVAVTITYRLGLFGYLGWDEQHPANLGLLDQLEALRWVRRNIAAFGGDPDRLTLYGQSAGGDAVAHLLALPGIEDLVSRAIVQSAPLGISRGRARMSARMAQAAAHLTRTTPIPEMLASEKRVSAAASRFGLRGGMPFGVQYGLDPLPAERDLRGAWDRVAPRVPVLIGSTAEEARMFVVRDPLLRRLFALPGLGSPIRRAVVGVLTRTVYGRDARRFARRHASAGGDAHLYVISWPAPAEGFGASHTVDLPLLFGDEEAWADSALLSGADWARVAGSAKAVRGIWGAFAHGVDLGDEMEVDGVIRVERVR